MNSRNNPKRLVSNTMFISQVAAISVYGIATAIISFIAGETLAGALVLLLVAALVSVVVVFQLPAYFARSLSLRGLITIAMVFSVFALTLAISEASSFVGLPDFLASRSGTQNLMAAALLGAICFGIAFIANLLAAISTIRS